MTLDCGKEPQRCTGANNVEIWYWKDIGSFDVTLTLKHKQPDNSLSDLGSCKRSFTVERNATDPERGPVVFFTTRRTSDLTRKYFLEGPVDVHARWHEDRDNKFAFPQFPGEDWLFFHRALIEAFDEWREFFGYPRVTPWDGSTPLPTTDDVYTMADVTRPGTEGTVVHCGASPCAPPPWFSPAGNGTPRPADLPGGRVCYDHLGNPVGTGQMTLADFHDSQALGCVLNSTYHATMHQSIPGSFPWIPNTARDPIFWAFHKYLAGAPFTSLTPTTTTTTTPATTTMPMGALLVRSVVASTATPATPSVYTLWEQEMAKGPPGLSGVFPTRGLSLASLPSVIVAFWEPVTGVVAGDLTVNGAPATMVDGSGAGPYTFTGFPSPGVPVSMPVAVQVALASGAIRDVDANPFPGEAWSYTLATDRDGDTIPDERDNCPDTPNTDQRNSSTQIVDDAVGTEEFGRFGHPEGDACSNDADGDGIDDATELANGSDPENYYDPYVCPLDQPPKVSPGACGCTYIDVPGPGGVSCVPEGTPSSTTTTTSTLPGQGCATLQCDDGDPCTTNSCVPGLGCVRGDLSGLARARCVCDRPPLPACGGQTVPPPIARNATKACGLLAKAAAPGTSLKKAKKLVKQADTAWKLALKASASRRTTKKLTPGCVTALKSGLADDQLRADRAAHGQ